MANSLKDFSDRAIEENSKQPVMHITWKRNGDPFQGLCSVESNDNFVKALQITKAESVASSLISYSSINIIRSQLGGCYFNDGKLEPYLNPRSLEQKLKSLPLKKASEKSTVIVVTVAAALILAVIAFVFL